MDNIKKGQSSIEMAKKRYALLDEVRGFLVLCMVVYHGLLSLYQIFSWDVADELFGFFTPVEPYFAGAFILLSGMMCGFSRSNIKRGAACFLIALCVTTITVIGSKWLGRIDIYFGILHLLGFSMLFCGIFNFALKRINKWVGLIGSALLYVVFHGVPVGYTDFVGIHDVIPASFNQIKWIFPFGITSSGFHSADYFPIIPWFFLFLCGYYLYRFHFVEKHKKVFEPVRIPPLGFLGRHALLIYVVHQPFIYLICMPFTLWATK